MVARAENVTAGAVVAEGLAAAGAVVSRGCVAARAVETAEVVGAGGCVAAGTKKVARLAVVRGYWAVATTTSRGWPKPGAAGQRGRQKWRGWPGSEAARGHERAVVAGRFLVHIVVRCRLHGYVRRRQ